MKRLTTTPILEVVLDVTLIHQALKTPPPMNLSDLRLLVHTL